MLSLPQPENSEIIEGCPVVHLHDSTLDTTNFLKAIFHYEFFEPFPAEVDFPTVSGVLRLSNKYQVDPLRKHALRHLSEHYPMSLDQWDQDKSWNPNPVDVINLAREISADWILPLALYRCCDARTLKQLLKGGLEEGTTAKSGVLSLPDIHVCVQALSTLHVRNSSVLKFLLEPITIVHCVSPQKCLENRMRVRADWDQISPDYLPLDVWDTDDWRHLHLCVWRRPKLKETHTASVKDFWSTLPGIFGLPDWETLETIKRAAFD
ncbi:hypothetical protein C8J57DRAFT_1346616 [Mycena rebaudengoi]|nr:hypothetical protein C8J57DRAFT_1346616 [Mycena rebaudengoi]